MSATHDISRRFFADFIASRIKAWTTEEGSGRKAEPARLPTMATQPETSLLRLTRHRSMTSVGSVPGLGSSGA